MARRISLVAVTSRRRRIRRLLFWGGIAAAVLGFIVAVGWMAARSSLFHIKDIRIQGASYVPETDIRAFLESRVAQGGVKRFFGAQNLLMWPDGFVQNELDGLPSLISIVIDKDYIHRTVTVVVAERMRIGQWCFVKLEFPQCFWFDDSGRLFMYGYPSEGNLIPVVLDHSRAPLALGQVALPEKFIPNLLSVFNALTATDISVREVRLDSLALEEVVVDTYEGPRLLFSLRFSAAPATDAIKALAKISPLSKFEYVDFRVENKVYYK